MECATPALKRGHRKILLLTELLHRIGTVIKQIYQFTPLLHTLSCSATLHSLSPVILGDQTLGNVSVVGNTVLNRALTAFQPDHLHPFVGNLRQDMPAGVIFNLVDYLELVDWTGRQIREDKVGAIPTEAKPILQRLSISPEHWVYLCTHFESRFKGLVGSIHSLENACRQFKRKRRPNLSASAELFN